MWLDYEQKDLRLVIYIGQFERYFLLFKNLSDKAIKQGRKYEGRSSPSVLPETA